MRRSARGCRSLRCDDDREKAQCWGGRLAGVECSWSPQIRGPRNCGAYNRTSRIDANNFTMRCPYATARKPKDASKGSGASADFRPEEGRHRADDGISRNIDPVVSRNSNEAIGQCASRLLDDRRRLVSPYTPLQCPHRLSLFSCCS
jgi:hypothetical protein